MPKESLQYSQVKGTLFAEKATYWSVAESKPEPRCGVGEDQQQGKLVHGLTLEFYNRLLRADLEDMIQPPHPTLLTLCHQLSIAMVKQK